VSDKTAHNRLNSLNESSLLASFAGEDESFFGLFLSLGVFADFDFALSSLDGVFGFGVQPITYKHNSIILGIICSQCTLPTFHVQGGNE
jgi:hypothetical protein